MLIVMVFNISASGIENEMKRSLLLYIVVERNIITLYND